jgi:hypothetical protein
MPSQKPKPHLQNKNSLFVEAERADSAPAPTAEATTAMDPEAQNARRDGKRSGKGAGKNSRPKGRSRT